MIAVFATLISTVLGTLAALGLSRSAMPFKTAFMALLISPMIVPLIISATGMYFFYALIGISSTHLGVILAHAALGTPFVVITVTATLAGFDHSLPRVAATLGANPVQTFFKVTMPLILPGVVSGALFAFITSFDEVVVVLFVGSVEQRTIPWKIVLGHPGGDPPDHPRGGHAPCLCLDPAPDDTRAVAPARRAAARHQGELSPDPSSPLRMRHSRGTGCVETRHAGTLRNRHSRESGNPGGVGRVPQSLASRSRRTRSALESRRGLPFFRPSRVRKGASNSSMWSTSSGSAAGFLIFARNSPT